MNCDFKTIEENVHQCQRCGYKIKIKQKPEKIYRDCAPPKEASLLDKVSNAGSALVDYIADGFKNVADDEQNRRLDICKLCEHYNNGSCKLCGCNMNLKSRISSSNCPINKW